MNPTPEKPPRPLSVVDAEKEALKRQVEELKRQLGRDSEPPASGFPDMSDPPPAPDRRRRERQSVEFHLHGLPGTTAQGRLDKQATDARVAASEPPPPHKTRGQQVRDQLTPALVSLVTALTTALGTYAATRPAPAEEQQAKGGYGLLKPEVDKLSTDVRRATESLAEFQGFFYGYLQATGVKLPEKASRDATKVEIVTTPATGSTIAPVLAPTVRGAPAKPARIEIKTEPPAAPDVPELVKLPETIPTK